MGAVSGAAAGLAQGGGGVGSCLRPGLAGGVGTVPGAVQPLIFLFFSAFVGAYLLYSWGTQEFERLKRKNPADYENDQ
uniref:Cytochrome b-c1 complex subunit 8 n=1 Tax=Apteryx owenii TaxID=8824 RepID=A0A8B9S7B7_APTOW